MTFWGTPLFYQRLVGLNVKLCLVVLLVFSSEVYAICSDEDARAAADAVALGLYKNGSVFRRAVVYTRHHPSGNKEVASYVKIDDKHYTLVSLVFDDCRAEFRKRTRRAS